MSTHVLDASQEAGALGSNAGSGFISHGHPHAGCLSFLMCLTRELDQVIFWQVFSGPSRVWLVTMEGGSGAEFRDPTSHGSPLPSFPLAVCLSRCAQVRLCPRVGRCGCCRWKWGYVATWVPWQVPHEVRGCSLSSLLSSLSLHWPRGISMGRGWRAGFRSSVVS